jgi:hypothetical protein
VAAIIEFQIAPDPDMFGRMMVAGGICVQKLKPTNLPGDRYELCAVVVNLTGKGDCARDMALGTTQWKLTPQEINLEELDAAVVLEEIARGEAPKEVLAWIPLMKKGGEDAIITRWLQIASTEPDLKKRGVYALAVDFAGAVRLEELWEKRLEGFTMIDSPVVSKWKAEAARKAKIESLVAILQERFKGAVTAELIAAIQASQDADQIQRWTIQAATALTLEQFRQEASI